MKINRNDLGFNAWFEDGDGNKVTHDDPKACIYVVRNPMRVTTEYSEYSYHPNNKLIRYMCRKSKRFNAHMTKKHGKTFKDICTFSTTFGGGQDTILAMTNSGDYTLIEAIDLWTRSCERCMNALSYKYLNGADGYPEFSDEWKRCNTVCEFCKEE